MFTHVKILKKVGDFLKYKCEYCGTVNLFNKTGYCKNCDRRLSTNTPISPQKTVLNPETYLDRTVIECSVDKETTINRLMQMTEKCRDTLKNGQEIEFKCNKEGEFEIIPSNSEKLFYISGKVYEEYGQTKVSILSNKQKLSISKWLYPLFILVSLIVFLVTKKHFIKFTTFDVVFVLIFFFYELSLLLNLKKLIKNSSEDLTLMKSEVIRRIRAVEKWER